MLPQKENVDLLSNVINFQTQYPYDYVSNKVINKQIEIQNVPHQRRRAGCLLTFDKFGFTTNAKICQKLDLDESKGLDKTNMKIICPFPSTTAETFIP